MSTPNTKTPRIHSVDALRGFAVMAIILVHNLEHFIFPVYPAHAPVWLNALDQGVFNVVFSLFAGKAYAIFALLFGFTFYIQSHHQRLLGKDFGPRFLWRLVLLAGFATLDAAFFPAGDVLLLFVVVGLVLYVARRWNDRAIGLAAVFFLLQPMEWFHYMERLLNPAHQLPDLGVADMYAQVATRTRGGSLADFFLTNITLGQKASLLWAVNAGRFFQTSGLFLLGFYIGRKQLFVPTVRNRRLWMLTLIASAVAFAPLYSLKELIMQGDAFVQQTAGTAFDMWQKLAFTLVLITSFLTLYRLPSFSRGVNLLRYYGKMSLTNYISQSVIGAFLYFPLGLYMAPHCGYTLSLLVGLATFAAQLAFCKWWLGRHKQGPLERIWHRWTWFGAKP